MRLLQADIKGGWNLTSWRKCGSGWGPWTAAGARLRGAKRCWVQLDLRSSIKLPSPAGYWVGLGGGTGPGLCLRSASLLYCIQRKLLCCRVEHLINKCSDELSLVLKDNCDQLSFLTSFTNHCLPLAVRQEYSQNCDDGHSKTFLFFFKDLHFSGEKKKIR